MGQGLAAVLAACIFQSAVHGTAFAQSDQDESVIESVKVGFEGTEYVIAYKALMVNIERIVVDQFAIVIAASSEEEGRLEISIPYELIKAVWPDLSSAATTALNIDIDGEFVEFQTTSVGSMKTFSLEVPVGAESISIHGTLIPADIPSITIGTSSRWSEPGSEVAIGGRLWNLIEPGSIPIAIRVVDSTGSEIWNGSATTNQTGHFGASFSLSSGSSGGSYEILAELRNHPEYQDTQGYGYFYVNSPGSFKVTSDGISKVFYVSSNSASYEPFLMKENKILGLIITGDVEPNGITTMVLPHDLLGGNLSTIGMDSAFEVQSNATHSTVELRYDSSSQPIVVGIMGTTVIPEFGPVSALILAFVISGVTIASLSMRKARKTR
jgi:hypothetical protein